MCTEVKKKRRTTSSYIGAIESLVIKGTDKIMLFIGMISWAGKTSFAAICNSYNMGKRDLPDIYALARGPQARGRGHIYQANPDCPCYK